jgi:hypothetical protein
VSGQLHASAALPPGKSSWCPLHRRLLRPQIRSGRCGEGGKIKIVKWNIFKDLNETHVSWEIIHKYAHEELLVLMILYIVNYFRFQNEKQITLYLRYLPL